MELGNQVAYAYDANSNVILVKRVDRSTITEPVNLQEEFVTAMRYDSLGRLVAQAQTNPSGITS